MKLNQLIMAVVLCVALLSGCGGGGEPKAEIVSARLVPFTTAQGVATRIVLVEWKNTGTAPVRKLQANITTYDAANNVFDRAPDFFIYIVGKTDPGIAPGATYRQTGDEGYVVPPLQPGVQPVRVEAVITKVSSEGVSG